MRQRSLRWIIRNDAKRYLWYKVEMSCRQPFFSVLALGALVVTCALGGCRTSGGAGKVSAFKPLEKKSAPTKQQPVGDSDPSKRKLEDSRFVSFKVNPREQNVAFVQFEKQKVGIGTIEAAQELFKGEGKELLFAMNGGMFHSDYSPVGLYVEEGKEISPLNQEDGEGNFFLKPNGVFFITENQEAGIQTTQKYFKEDREDIEWATQSGPMLLIGGEIHPGFEKNSKNLHVRNGVGILPDNTVVFAISTEKVNFYDFAMHMKELGCQNALYLDGFVSTMYLPGRIVGDVKGQFPILITVSRPPAS